MELININKRKNFDIMFLIAIIVAFSSQIYLNLIITNFRISFAIIILPVCLFVFRDLSPIKTGLLASVLVYAMRIVFYFINNDLQTSSLIEAFHIFFPENFFYMGYSIIFYFLSKRNKTYDINKMFVILIISDAVANAAEVLVRKAFTAENVNLNIFLGLVLVAIIRSSIAWVMLNIIKQYNMLLLKKDHEDRYRKLLYIISRLKGEVYWMEKSMNSIENVMSNAYDLHVEISSNDNRELWCEQSLSIAKDIHEIKKEYRLVLRGVEEIIDNKLYDRGMCFHDILDILMDTLQKDANAQGKNVFFNYKKGRNFYTANHYHLMSIFRNLIMNSIDAIDKEGSITFEHMELEKENKQHHVFVIEDTGMGIQEEDSKHIFSPGFSTKINYSTGNINRGLGLSIVKEIVENTFNGNVEVFSEADKGTKFTIYIPKEELEELNNEHINS